MTRDLRICFVGDSFVAGHGDPLGAGWVGRTVARSFAGGQPLTAYNLGVRRQTTTDVLARWEAECEQRLRNGDDHRVVFSFGVNDTTGEGGGTRVVAEESAANLARLLKGAAARGWPLAVVGPPPVGDPAQNGRTALLDAEFARICRAAGVPYIPVYDALLEDAVWMHEVRVGDGAHPGAGGYEALTALVAPYLCTWLAAGPEARPEAGRPADPYLR